MSPGDGAVGLFPQSAQASSSVANVVAASLKLAAVSFVLDAVAKLYR